MDTDGSKQIYPYSVQKPKYQSAYWWPKIVQRRREQREYIPNPIMIFKKEPNIKTADQVTDDLLLRL